MADLPHLQIIIASTREQRGGAAVATWFTALAENHGGFSVEVVDLKAVALPLFDEPHHPRLKKYEREHTKAWSKRIDAADAFVWVTPEYNYSMPPAMVNAVDYLSQEWAYKAASFVSYGGVSGGTRAVQMAKQLLTAVKIMPIPEAVHIPFYAKQIKDGVFDPGTTQDAAVKLMLDELRRWTLALATLRPPR